MIALAVLLVIGGLLVWKVAKEIDELDRVERELRERREAENRFLDARSEQLCREIEEATGRMQPIADSFERADAAPSDADWTTGEALHIPNMRPLCRPKELTDPDRLAMIRERRING